MSGYVGATFVAAFFLVVVRAVGLFGLPGDVFRISSEAMGVLRSSIGDDAKEAALQRHSVSLAKLTLRILGSAGLALGAPLVCVWLLDRARLLSLDATLEVLASWPFLLGATAIVGMVAWIRKASTRGA